MASKARSSRWAAMSAGTSFAVLSLALTLAPLRAEEAAVQAPGIEEPLALAPLDDVLPLDRPVVIAAEPEPAPAAPQAPSVASAPPAAPLPEPAPAASAAIDIPPPDLPPVEVVIEPQASPSPSEQAAAPASAPVTAAIVLPELPPDTPAPAIVAEAPADPLLPVTTALKDLLAAAPTTKGVTIQVSKRDRERVAEFYESRAFRPLFVDATGLTPAGHGIARQVATAELDGLDPSSYPLPHLDAATPANLAEVELGSALAAFAYARDARGGRLDPTRLSALITPDVELPAVADVLAGLAESADSAAALAAYQPRHPGYLALKQKLAELRETTGAVSQRATIGEGPTLRVGMHDPRVPALRARLGLEPARADLFDGDVSAALAGWQKQQGLRPTGRLDRGMASALDGRTATGVGAADIVANMERWRWLPQDLGARHIEVNLPEFTLRVMQDDKVIHQTRVVIGKTQTPTPIFSNRMQYVVVNPYWNIPPSIMKKEILPKLAEDPNYATAHGYEVIHRGNSVIVRQPPGERNALGFIKFLFPNQHAVYLHDTPSRALFAQDKRAFSHGCVRVEQPFRLGEVVLGNEGYDEDRLRKLVGKGERTIRLKEPLPIHLTYFTLFVDDHGRLQRRDDLYGYDGRVKTALGINPNGLKYANLR